VSLNCEQRLDQLEIARVVERVDTLPSAQSFWHFAFLESYRNNEDRAIWTFVSSIKNQPYFLLKESDF